MTDRERFRVTLTRLRRTWIAKIAKSEDWQFEDERDVAMDAIDLALSEVEKTADEFRRVEMLKQDEIRALITEALASNIRSEDDIEKVIRWAEEVRTGETLLDGLLMGKFIVKIRDDGELVFTVKEKHE